jgi:hypothetical protein
LEALALELDVAVKINRAGEAVNVAVVRCNEREPVVENNTSRLAITVSPAP